MNPIMNPTMNPTMIPTNIIPRQKVFYYEVPYTLDDDVNDFIKNIYEKGFRVISISTSLEGQGRFRCSTVIIYG